MVKYGACIPAGIRSCCRLYRLGIDAKNDDGGQLGLRDPAWFAGGLQGPRPPLGGYHNEYPDDSEYQYINEHEDERNTHQRLHLQTHGPVH